MFRADEIAQVYAAELDRHRGPVIAKAVYQELLASCAGRFSVKQRSSRIVVTHSEDPQQPDLPGIWQT